MRTQATREPLGYTAVATFPNGFHTGGFRDRCRFGAVGVIGSENAGSAVA
jgi:hypothetical protein